MKNKEQSHLQKYMKGTLFNMRKVRWGVLGAAEIAEEQVIPAIQQSRNGKVIAIASRKPDGKAKKLAENFRILKVHLSYEDLLTDPDIDAVYIPLPNDLHAEWTKKALRYGKHVLCEKPAGLSAEQVKEMVAISREQEITFMEAMMYQFHPQHKRVKEMIEKGKIGEVKQMRASFTFMLEDQKGNFRMKPQDNGGGSIYDIGCYTIHAIRSILGEPKNILFVDETLTEDGLTDIAAIGIFEHENGIKSYFDCGMNMSTRNEYEVIGTKGTIRVPNAFIPQKDGKGIIQFISVDGSIATENISENYYVKGIEYFSDHVIAGNDLSSLEDDTINNMKVIDRALDWRKTSLST